MTAVSLLVTTTSFAAALVYPQTDNLAEFYMFGPNCDTEYPSNIAANQNFVYIRHYQLFGFIGLLIIQLKFRDQAQSAPSGFCHTSGATCPRYRPDNFVAKDSTGELPRYLLPIYNQRGPYAVGMHITVNGFSLDANDTTGLG